MVVPFKVKKWLDSRITAIGFRYRQKDSDFWDIPFDRKLYTFVLTIEQYLHSFHQTRFEVYSKRILSEQGDTRHFRPSPFGKSGCGLRYTSQRESTTDLEMRRHI